VLAALLRAAGRCELGDHDAAGSPLEPHHLELGQGKTKNEKLSNVIAACRDDPAPSTDTTEPGHE
jgi:hypothetical protein